ncbi:MAG: Zn-ribbon domain-containing OB-fold protein [Deltaproteobacteria bacterium]|nr:Zn-ribbon domain-containing OB-fold protein [Deltaproteobacteria bacterium]
MDIARSWRQQDSNLRLVGSRCRVCEALVFPQRLRCPSCGGADLADHAFQGGGTTVSVATVREAPRGFAGQVPYAAALVRLDEGPVVAAMLADVEPEEACPGMRVSMITRRIRQDGDDGPIVYGYKFAPEGSP